MSDPAPRSREVFLSYSMKNKDWADAACAVLEKRRLRCWIAPRDILPGTEWGAAIMGGIASCKIMVLIFSAHANASPQVRREVERAISKGMPLLPVRIEDVLPDGAMEYALGNTHWLDAFTPSRERHLEALAGAVEALIVRETPIRPPVTPAHPAEEPRPPGTRPPMDAFFWRSVFSKPEEPRPPGTRPPMGRWIAAAFDAIQPIEASKPEPTPSADRVLTLPPAVDETLITNSLGMTFRLIPAGEFLMGSDDSDPMASSDEKVNGKKHHVRITKAFYLGTTEVTVGQFRKFVDQSGYQTEAEKAGEGKTWRSSGYPQTDDHPVVYVSWNDAKAFCDWLSKKEGETYRLPTEAEWEYSCRAGQASRYSSGDDPESLATVGNVGGSGGPKPVGKLQRNPFGLFDMHGNVWEWCADWYDDYYAKSPTDDPPGPPNGASRVIRGGSWGSGGRYCRSASRNGDGPADRDYFMGFRVARVPSGQ
jgi:sulfatase modifying factor 1